MIVSEWPLHYSQYNSLSVLGALHKQVSWLIVNCCCFKSLSGIFCWYEDAKVRQSYWSSAPTSLAQEGISIVLHSFWWHFDLDDLLTLMTSWPLWLVDISDRLTLWPVLPVWGQPPCGRWRGHWPRAGRSDTRSAPRSLWMSQSPPPAYPAAHL